MTEQNSKRFIKCPHCSCLFLTQTDLQKHIAAFGTAKEQHAQNYNKTHGRLEHGYGEE
jgi:uncharacterized C2H2 Zn-finger protein